MAGGGKGRQHTTGRGSSTRYVKYSSRLVKLSYLQTIQVQTDERAAGQLAGETEGRQSQSQIRQPARGRGLLRTILDPLGIFGGGSRSKQWNYSTNDTGWSITRQWLETQWDIIRYAIGIRDIQVFNFKFSPVAEVVSKRFTSPKEIIKVQLQVDEQIPDIFPLTQRWIEYYISADDGENWIRMNPLNHPTLFDSSGRITARTVNFNLDTGGPTDDDIKNFTTDTPVLGIRFRAVLKTDTSILNGDRYTPVLKKYKLKIFPRGGLSTNEGRNA